MALYPCVRVFLKEQSSVVVDKDLLLTVQPNLHGRRPAAPLGLKCAGLRRFYTPIAPLVLC